MVQINLLDISYLGIFVGTFTSFIIGFLWYGPIFGGTWIQSLGLPRRDVEKIQIRQQSLMGVGVFLDLLCCFSLACFINFMQARDVSEVLQLVFIIWLGFIVTISLNGFLWEGEMFTFYAISVGHKLLSFAGMGVVYYLSAQLDHLQDEIKDV